MLAIVLVLVAMPLQLMGYSSTCTMGDDKPYATGALLSALPLLAALAMLIRQGLVGNRKAGSDAITAAIAVVLVSLTSVAWLNVIRFGTACGAVQALGEQFDFSDMLVLFSYLILPALIIAAAARSAFLAQTNAERLHP